jgi:hypothetical protein
MNNRLLLFVREPGVLNSRFVHGESLKFKQIGQVTL